MIHPVSASPATQQLAPVAPKKDSDGDSDKSAPTAASIGPAVVMNLSNTAAAKNDMAAGDPDHDGR